MPTEDARVAVAIPCFNEAPAIVGVIHEWRKALPGAEILVIDNRSTDGTGELARQAGARVIEVPRQGKGHAVRAAFRELADHDAVILVDGDGTYPAAEVGPLLEPVLRGEAEMTIGARKPVARPGAMTLTRRIGNVLIRGLFRILIGPGIGDLLSGYRVFSRTFLATVQLRSSGFEIETELAIESVARRLTCLEIEVSYLPRAEGTQSKLRAFRDGWRISRMIVVKSLVLTPWRPAAILGTALVLVGAGLQTWGTAGCGALIVVVAGIWSAIHARPANSPQSSLDSRPDRESGRNP